MTPHLTACPRGCGTRWRWSQPRELATARHTHKCARLPYVPKHMKRGSHA